MNHTSLIIATSLIFDYLEINWDGLNVNVRIGLNVTILFCSPQFKNPVKKRKLNKWFYMLRKTKENA
ncbi:hypothetical protein BpHYR1_044095 [Brachionus plicatilis]|uniref:Uncharacterized protein n=1 Tax=Brachionus plicatilis TaxID=10195 RepID=A0A3M7RNH9_BRAPC|nr:hypothetical protein BpHYR1_044095 [Brachionus plicatilis]